MINDLHTFLQQPGHPHKLDVYNQLLLVLVWLKSYPPLYILSLLFDVSEETASREVSRTLPILWHYTKNVVRWPTVQEWRAIGATLDFFPNCVGFIDGTVHEIQRPRDNTAQRTVFDGHHRYHCLATQVICDSRRNIRYIQTGFDGHMNDAGMFLDMPSIGYTPNHLLQLPNECYLLADKGYANQYPLITPYKRNQMDGLPNDQLQTMRLFNTEHAAHRVVIEHVIRRMKTYRSVGLIFRHSLNDMPMVADICAFLAQRNMNLINSLH